MQTPPKCNPFPSSMVPMNYLGTHMETGKYATEFDKLALAVESTKVAKAITVEQDGIGEDININLFSWKGEDLVCIKQIRDTHHLDKEVRLDILTKGACIMRRGWGVDEFTFVAEGYCSLKPSETKDSDLAELFSHQDSPVKECLSFTHISADGATFISVPYSVDIGRKVKFDSALWYAGLDVMRDLTYPATLKASLKLEPIQIDEQEIDRESYFSTLASGLTETGFEVFYRDDV